MVACIAELFATAVATATNQTVLDARKRMWLVDSQVELGVCVCGGGFHALSLRRGEGDGGLARATLVRYMYSSVRLSARPPHLQWPGYVCVCVVERHRESVKPSASCCLPGTPCPRGPRRPPSSSGLGDA